MRWRWFRLIRVNTYNWTADYQISRYLFSAYADVRAQHVAVAAITRLELDEGDAMQAAADELKRYHPAVDGTSREPIMPDEMDRWLKRVKSQPDVLAVVLDVAPAPSQEHGILWLGGPAIPTDTEDDAMATAALEWELTGTPYIPQIDPVGDVMLVALLDADRSNDSAGANKGNSRSHRRRLQACTDMVVDGLLRFYAKIGHDHRPLFRHRS